MPSGRVMLGTAITVRPLVEFSRILSAIPMPHFASWDGPVGNGALYDLIRIS